MFKVTEEKTVEYWFAVETEQGELLEVSGAKDTLEATFLEKRLNVSGSKDVAAELRKLADAILKIASKLEAIK